MAVMSFLLPEKPHSASLGISAQLWCATVNKALGKKRERLYVPPCWRPLKSFLTDIEGGLGRGPVEVEECDGRKNRRRWRRNSD